MIFHFGVVEVVEQECGTLLNDNGVVPAVKWRCGFKGDLAVELRRGEQVASYKDELEEDLFQLGRVRVDDLVFLESF